MALQGEEQNKQLHALGERIERQSENIDGVVKLVERLYDVSKNHQRRVTDQEGG